VYILLGSIPYGNAYDILFEESKVKMSLENLCTQNNKVVGCLSFDDVQA
jgi:hypothetical protein